MDKLKLSANFTLKGYWWLPNKAVNKIPGELKFCKDNGLVLELNGALGQLGRPIATADIILGVTPNGKHITLVNCQEYGFSMSFPGYQTENYMPQQLIHGYHFNSLSEIRFKRFYIKFNHLNDWIDETGFKNYETNFKNGDTSLEYSRPSEKVLYRNKSYKILLQHNIIRPAFITVNTSTIQFDEEKYIVIEFKNRVSIDRYLQVIYIIKNFISLATSQIIVPLEINATVFTKPKNNSMFDPVLINLIYKMRFWGVDEKKKIDYRDQLFTYSDVKDNLNQYLSNWIDTFERFETVHELYFSIINNPKLYLTTKFLNSIYALESYHRQVTLIDENLRQRLEKIISNHKKIKTLFIKNNKHFLDKVIITRNYYTHYDKKKKKKALKGLDLYNVTQRLMLLLEVCFLSELGIPDKTIRAIYIKKERHKI